MADIRINQLPLGGGPVATDFVPLDNGSTRKATIADIVLVGRPSASQAEAEAGTDPTKAMTPLTTKQAVEFYGLTKAGNLAGLTNTVTARSNLGLGSAAVESASSFATAAQGLLADTALQPAAIGVSVAAQSDRRFDEAIVAQSGHTMPPETGWLQRYLHITGDNLDAQTVNPIARGLRIAHEVGGATLTGGRIATESSIIHTATDSASNTVKEFVALTGSAYGRASGGFGGTAMSPAGALFGGNFIVTTHTGYTFLDNITGLEVNTQMETGSSGRYKSIAQFVSRDQVHGSEIDTHIALSSIVGAVGSKAGILFGDMNGDPPVTSDGTLISSFTDDGVTLLNAAVGIDFTAWAFSDSLLKSGGYVIKAGGNVVAGATTAAQVQYDLKSSGAGSNFDVRLAATGGTGTDGQGTLTVVAAKTKLLSAIEFANVPGPPATANTFTITFDTSAFYLRGESGGTIYRGTLAVVAEP